MLGRLPCELLVLIVRQLPDLDSCRALRAAWPRLAREPPRPPNIWLRFRAEPRRMFGVDLAKDGSTYGCDLSPRTIRTWAAGGPAQGAWELFAYYHPETRFLGEVGRLPLIQAFYARAAELALARQAKLAREWEAESARENDTLLFQ